MSRHPSELSIVLQALLDQQQAAFADLMQQQLRAMAQEDFCDQQGQLWKTFNDAYRLGLAHGRELETLKINHDSDE